MLPYLRVLQAAASEQFAQPVNLYALSRPGVDYALGVAQNGEIFWLGFSHERIGTAPVMTMFVMLLLVALSAALGSWLLARWLARPLEALRLGVLQLADDRKSLISVDSGVKELNDLAHAYNVLAGDLRRMVEQRSHLLAGIAHDLRTPMTRMELALELARLKPESSRLERIAADVQEMRELVESYLDFAAGCVHRPAESFNLHARLHALIERRMATVALDAPSIEVQLHRQAFDRVIGNLLDNAFKHGRPPVALRAKLHASSLHIEIENAGEALSEDECALAFEPFTRLDAARNPQRPGSGLGLSIVRDIAAANGWRVGLTPRAGGGVIAWLELPHAED
jgi:two-component system osmolarity sensor histidine kinase EnvZ